MSDCDDNLLLQYRLKRLSETDAAELRRHLADCPSCAIYLAAMSSGSEEEPVRLPENPSAAVEEMLQLPLAEWCGFFAFRRHAFENPVAVQVLIQRCEDAIDRNAVRAEKISAILVQSADALRPSIISRTLQALALTRRASTLQRLGKLQEALAAIAAAEDRVRDIPAADYEHALIAFTATDIHRELGRIDEALREIREASAVFEQYNDRRRHASAREMEAAVLFRAGEYQRAVDVFVSLMEAPISSEAIVRGRLAANAAHALVALKDYQRALPLYAEAERICTDLGYHGYVTRIAWGRARATHAMGDVTAAIEDLRNVRARFEAQTAIPEWVRAGIELVEWLLPLDAFAEVRTICAGVYERAIASGMQMQAIEAVTYMREAAQAGTLTADRAQYVRNFIEGLPSRPTTAFQRPA
jgi:tetratricopeptide (TPR) repeat protein